MSTASLFTVRTGGGEGSRAFVGEGCASSPIALGVRELEATVSESGEATRFCIVYGVLLCAGAKIVVEEGAELCGVKESED